MKKTLFTTAVGTSMALMIGVGTALADKLRIAYDAPPVTADPYRNGNTPTGSLNSHMYEGLIARHGDFLLGTKFEWVTPTRMMVDLRKGVKFHNGADFTSHDVVYSVCRMMLKVNGKNNVVTNSLSPVVDVKAMGPYQVAFDTVKPYPLLIQKLKYLYVFSAGLGTDVPETIKFDKSGKCGIGGYPSTAQVESGEASVGTGPYKLVSYTKNGTTKMIRNENYWGKKPDWKEVEITPITNTGARVAGLLSGDYDLVVSPSLEDLDSIRKKKGFNVYTAPAWDSRFILLNLADDAPGVTAPDGKNPLQDIRVRKALSLAINRQAITDRLLAGNGTPAAHFAPSYMPGADAGMPELEYNPEKAKKLLAEAGYAEGVEIELFLASDRYPNITRIGQVVAQFWEKVGIKVKLTPQPWSVFSKTRSGKKLGVWLYGWTLPQGFTQMIIFNFPSFNKDLSLGGHNKYTNYQNPVIDDLMTKWAMETNTEIADGYGREVMKTLVEDMAGIPLYYPHATWGYRDGLNFNPTPAGFTKAEHVTKK